MMTTVMEGCIFIYQQLNHPSPYKEEKDPVKKLVGIAPIEKLAEVDTAIAEKNLANRRAKIFDITYFYERSAPISIFSGKGKINL